MVICAISDLHGTFPKSIPECDLLIVAGDVCPDIFPGRQYARNYPRVQLAWFEDTFVPWAERQPCEFAVSTWGNHDWCGHLKPNAEYDKLSVVSDGPIIINGVKLWLTPWSPTFMDWAWMTSHAELGRIYAKIPDDVDILVSHSPPYGMGDIYPNPDTGKREHVGSQALLYTIERIRPSICVCGHLHGGHGTYQHGDTVMYNVSILDEQYKLKYPVTEFEFGTNT
jgi:hypothetical protein